MLVRSHRTYTHYSKLSYLHIPIGTCDQWHTRLVQSNRNNSKFIPNIIVTQSTFGIIARYNKLGSII